MHSGMMKRFTEGLFRLDKLKLCEIVNNVFYLYEIKRKIGANDEKELFNGQGSM